MEAVRKEERLNGYTLTNELIRGRIAKLELNANAKLVLLYLSSCYNPRKKVVYPRIKTIAEALGLSEIGTKRAVAELVAKGCILKAKRTGNANEYVFTQKILNNNDDTLKYQNDTTESITMIPSCIEVKKKEIKKETVADCIKDNKNIKNPERYWAVLDDEAKKRYKEKDEIKKRRKEAENKRKIEQQKYFEELDKIKKEAPFYEEYTINEAVLYLKNTKRINMKLEKSKICQYLIKKFNLIEFR